MTCSPGNWMKTFPEALRRGVSGAIGVGEAQDLSGGIDPKNWRNDCWKYEQMKNAEHIKWSIKNTSFFWKVLLKTAFTKLLQLFHCKWLELWLLAGWLVFSRLWDPRKSKKPWQRMNRRDSKSSKKKNLRGIRLQEKLIHIGEKIRFLQLSSTFCLGRLEILPPRWVHFTWTCASPEESWQIFGSLELQRNQSDWWKILQQLYATKISSDSFGERKGTWANS